MTSVFHLAVYQQNTEYIYIDRRFVYTVILSAILIKKIKKRNTGLKNIFGENNKITGEARDLYLHPYDLMPQYAS